MNGIEIGSSQTLVDWKPILERWINELERMLELTHGLEAPYVHAEHGNTHHLAVSAAIEGYACIREVMGNRNGHSARLDLVLISDRYVDMVECKWWEFSLFGLPAASGISDKVKEACIDAMSYSNGSRMYSESGKELRRIGVAFFTPHYSENDSFSESKAQDAISLIKSAVSPDAIAWSFPPKTREMKYWQPPASV